MFLSAFCFHCKEVILHSYYSAIMLPPKKGLMGAYSRGALICKNEFLDGGLLEGAYLVVGVIRGGHIWWWGVIRGGHIWWWGVIRGFTASQLLVDTNVLRFFYSSYN